MAVGFGDVSFVVVPEGDLLPLPEADPQTGIETWRATILLPSRTQLNTLRSYLTGTTVLPALSGGGVVVIERGVGKKTLTYPGQAGVETSASAILIGMSSRVRMLRNQQHAAEVDFLLVPG